MAKFFSRFEVENLKAEMAELSQKLEKWKHW